MFNRSILIALVMALGLGLAAAPAYAQGGGASTTGSINGKVTDKTGAVLPGVTVTASSPAMMGTQSTVTNEQGIYRFAAVPSGTYRLMFEMAGFSTLSREGIVITLGFTATVNAEMNIASVQETVTVTGESPVVDVSTTRVQQNFNLEQMENLPNARDMWSLLAESPGVTMTRFDVGGNRAGTQTGYLAYGYGGQDQQVRVLVEGINTTEGTGGAGFYFDYGSFEEAFFGTAAQGAEMPHPGVQSQFIGKSGGNNFQGQVYFDYENNSLQGSNITDEQLARGVREGSNEINDYRDFNINLGGPITRDKLWWYFSYRDQYNGVFQSNFLFDQDFTTKLQNISGKGTFQLNQKNKFIGYLQFGRKYQPYRTATNSYSYTSADYTRSQDSWSWVWKGEWNWLINDQLYLEARYGNFGYFFPLEGYSSEPRREDDGTRIITGGDWQWQQDRNRNQGTGALTYFRDNWGGSHNFKFTGEINDERQKNGISEYYPGGVRHLFDNQSRSFRVVLGAPTADGSLDNLLSIAQLRHIALSVSDSWSIGNHATLNLGIRYDNYKSHVPEQRQLAYSFGPLNVPAATLPAQTFFTWNSVAPRAGITFDLAGDGKTVIKANYGYFGHNPGPGIAADANPNQLQKTVTYEWTDRNGDRLYQPGEEGALVTSNLAGAVGIDPDITQPYTHEAAVFFEREIRPDFGVRAGYVYKTNDNLWQSYRPGRPIEAHTVPFTQADIGPDGRAGTADDATLTFLGLPRAQLSQYPATQRTQNTDAIGRYKTVEMAANKRFSNKWSLVAAFQYEWTEEHNTGYQGNTVSPSRYPNSPNDTSLHEFNNWSFRAHGTYDAAYGIRISPILRHQSGVNYGRTLTVNASAASGAFYSGTILVEPVGTRRMDNISIFDIRAEKMLNLSRTQLRLFLDVFNIFNASSPEVISFGTGTAFEAPTIILAPRVLRVGLRFDW